MVKLCRWIKLRQSDVRVPETTKHTYYSTVQYSTASASQPFLNAQSSYTIYGREKEFVNFKSFYCLTKYYIAMTAKCCMQLDFEVGPMRLRS